MRSHDNKNEGIETSEIPKARLRKYNVYNIKDNQKSGEVNICNFEKSVKQHFFDPDTSNSFLGEEVIDKEYVKTILNKNQESRQIIDNEISISRKKEDKQIIDNEISISSKKEDKQIIDNEISISSKKEDKQIIDNDSGNSIVTSEIDEYTIIEDSNDTIMTDNNDTTLSDNDTSMVDNNEYVISSSEEEPEEFLEEANFFQRSSVESEITKTEADDDEFFSKIQKSRTLESFNNQSTGEIDSSISKVYKKFSIKTSRTQKKLGDAFSDDTDFNKELTNKESIDIISDAKIRTFRVATRQIEKFINSGIEFPVDIKGFEFGIEEISILKTHSWLNDKIVNCYMEYLHEFDKSVYVFTSYFYTNLRNGGLEKVLKYTADENLFDYRLLFFPVHLQNHWVFACYDVKKNLLEYRDSLFGQNYLVMEELSRFLEYEYKRIYDKELNVNTQIVNNIRGQDNGYDCGVFLLMYAKMRIKDKKDFFYRSMHKYRRIILYEILVKKKIRYDLYD